MLLLECSWLKIRWNLVEKWVGWHRRLLDAVPMPAWPVVTLILLLTSLSSRRNNG